MKITDLTLLRWLGLSLLVSGMMGPELARAQEQRVTLATQATSRLASAQDTGAVPGSQVMELTLSLAVDPARRAALAQTTAAQITPGSAQYHQWLTPEQFASRFGAPVEQLASATAWVQSQGLTVEKISASGLRLTVSGTASQIQTAFAVSLRKYQKSGSMYFSHATSPSVPAAAASLFGGIEGLSTLPSSSGTGLTASAQEAGQPAVTSVADFASLAGLIDRNAAPVVAVTSSLCAEDVTESQALAYTLLFEQANAQGISVFASQGCASGAFPAGLAEVTAAGISGKAAVDTVTPVVARPDWQTAQGLPQDLLRHEPDLTVSSVEALAQTISDVVTHTGVRQGNVNPVLYELTSVAGLYTQPAQSSNAGEWQAQTGLGLVDLARLARAYPQGSTATSLQVTPSTYSLIHGKTFTLSASVATQNGSATPTGTITFTSTQPGFTAVTIAVNTAGTATSSPLQLQGGTYPITATYSGDATYAAASGSTSVTVQKEDATFAITSPASVTLGGQLAGSVTLTSASGFGTPTGTVTVTPSGLPNATPVQLTPSGANGTATASFTYPANMAGTATFQATCSTSDVSFTCYAQPSSTTTVPQASPSVVLTASSNTPTAGSAVTYTATVSGVTGIAPTGGIQFLDGATVVGNGTAPTASVALTLAPGVAHSITAAYNGDTNYLKQTSNALTPSVGTASTTTTVAFSAASVSYGTTVNVIVTVTPAATVNGTAPTGTISITGAGSALSVPVTGNVTTIPLNTLAAGSYSISASYSGDLNYAASSTATSGMLTVTPIAATLVSQPSTTTFTQGSTSTLTEQIQLPGNAQLPASSTFTAVVTGAGQVYSGVFNINPGGNTGTGSVTLQAPVAGTYTVRVTCNAGSSITCAPSLFTITSTASTTTMPPNSGTVPTTTALAVSSTTAAAGVPVTLTATVAVAPGASLTSPISGTVSFFDGQTSIGKAPLTLAGTVETATLAVSLSGSATHSLIAIYSGDTVYLTSSSAPVSIVTTASASAITLAVSSTTGQTGSAVTFTAQVTGSTASGVLPTGTVSFYLASPVTLLGTSSLTGSGVATFTTAALPAGTDTVYAVYSGDGNFSAVTSTSVMVGFSDYGVTFNPATLTVVRGQSAQTTLTLNLINGYSSPVVFGCTPPPNVEMTCTFTPATLNGTLTTTLLITTTKPAGQAQAGRFSGVVVGLGWLGGLAGLSLVALTLPGMRRRRLPGLLILLMTLALVVNVGCSGGTFNAQGNALSGTPLGTSIFTITTSGTNGVTTVKHNYFLQVTVTE